MSGPSPIRVGVDLVSVARISQLLDSSSGRVLADHFTDREREELERVSNGRLETLSGRIAAKEAVIKVLAPEGEIIRWAEVEILGPAGRAPRAQLSGRAARLASERQLQAIDISISHEGPWAVAVAAGAIGAPGTDRDRHNGGEA
ncbi:4'-phosphopantetheinyl transferase superfamily protein [Streptomyces sp. NPDC047042]|uniref:holo-ACP synthase n=1 Tax=Streptomyces sp. NPDC047042 TaxID=3154807 RepID=UPI0033E73D86